MPSLTDRAERLLTVTEAAQEAGVSRPTVTAWITRGMLPTVRIEGRRYVRPTDLVATQATAHLGLVLPAWRHDPLHAGTRLRALREAAGLSQLHLAAISGVRHEVISVLEGGQRAPQAKTVRSLAQALQVDPEQFVRDDPIGLTRLTAAEAAARLDVPVERMYTWLKQGELAGEKVSREWRVPAIAVAELERSGRLRGRSRRLDPRYRG